MNRRDIDNQLELALAYHEQGLQLIPLPAGVKAAKRKWKHRLERPQTAGDVREMFGHQAVNTAIYSGPESGNFTTIDIDDPPLYSWACQNVRHFTDLVTRTLACKSGGRGGVHIGVKTERPLSNTHFNHPADPAKKGGDIIAAGGYALYPRSMVRGGAYQLLFDGFGGIVDLDIHDRALKDLIHVFNLREHVEPEPLPTRDTTTGIIYKDGKPYGLSLKAWNLLTKGDTAGRYATRSEADQAVIVSCVLRGWDLDTVRELFRRHSYQGGKYREKERHRDKYLAICYRNAEKYLSQNKAEIDTNIDRFHDLVNSWPWKGQGGRVDREITRALLEIARRRRSLDGFGASIRELGELAAIGTGPTHRALQRNPFITDSTTDGITCTFTLQAPYNTPCVKSVPVCKTQERTPTCVKSVPVLQSGNNTRADVFRWGGLGKAGADIYADLLQYGDSDIKTISERARVNIVTVYRKINDLERCGLVTVRKQGRQTILKAVQGADLDRAAEIIGTAGALKRQIERHDRERKAYQEYIKRVSH